MAIHGIGSDLIRVSRLAAVLGRHGDRFATRILAPEEQGAAKEAAAKALGTGIRDGLRLAHFAIGHDALGRPTLSLLKRAAELADAAGIIATHLSISDEGGWAQAFVVFEREVRSGRS